MDLVWFTGGGSRASVLELDHGPGGVDGVHLLVELVELEVGEDVVSLPPGHPQLVQTGSHLHRFYLRI